MYRVSGPSPQRIRADSTEFLFGCSRFPSPVALGVAVADGPRDCYAVSSRREVALRFAAVVLGCGSLEEFEDGAGEGAFDAGLRVA